MSHNKPLEAFKDSAALSLGVELELQLVSKRDFDLTRGATDLIGALNYDERFGEIKLEITESMIEISTLPRLTVDGIAADLGGLRDTLLSHCERNNIGVCGGGTHPFHHWPERRICPGDRFDQIYQRYGYLAKQFTVFGQHIHVGCTSADDAIWLTQALGVYVPAFIALSASSPFVDGVDSFYQSARLNAVSAFPLSGQCPALDSWAHFVEHFGFLQACGIAQGIKDLYWDVRPKPEFGTVEIRVCDTPLSIEQASSLAALAQSLSRWLLRTRPPLATGKQAHVARYNKFQACRYGLDAMISDPVALCQIPLKESLGSLLEDLAEDARALGCEHWLNPLRRMVAENTGDAKWLRTQQSQHGNLNDVVRQASACLRRKDNPFLEKNS
ncbi:MAG: YbdK family carboxylate-amine ligase [Rhodocyclaceae bacterium]|nr:YbdK family carboxylate-amine ligase [Rhodocyclaceae bacterium]